MISITTSQALPSLHAEKTNIHTKQSESIFAPIQKQITKLSIVINREIPKRMKQLKNNPSWVAILSSTFAAFLYGILHTLGPGHGKMVVASYFLTNGAHIGRGIWMGSQVAISHVGGSLLIVLVANITLKNVLTSPEQQVFWVKIFSYSVIITIGLYMFFQVIRQYLQKGQTIHKCGHCNHQHQHKNKKETLLSWAVGVVPCTGALLILVYAMAYNVLWLGILMVFFIALGMALTMILIGVLCILGKKKFIDKLSKENKTSLWKSLLEILGAVTIIFIGSMLLLNILTK